MLINILLVVFALAVVFFIVVSSRPADFRVSRSASFAAPPAIVFPHVNDLHKWQEWSPWAKIDLECKYTYEGPVAGVGASFSWAGNSKVGQGRMTIMESRPNDLIRIKLEFLKPFKATNTAEWTFRNEGTSTVVTWAMTGKNNFVFKAISLFMDCEKMVGPQFEQGLADLKKIVEAEAKA